MPLQEEVATNNARPGDEEVHTNPTREDEQPNKKGVEKPQDQEELPWFQTHKELLIGGVIIVVFAICITAILAAGGGGGGGDERVGASETAPTIAPSADFGNSLSMPPTTFFNTLDKDNDGFAEFECSVEPYFDAQGRLIFTACDVA